MPKHAGDNEKQTPRSNSLVSAAETNNSYSSFKEFIEFMNDREHAFSLSPSTYSSFLSSFMRDPYRHQKFVDVIFAAAVHSELKRSIGVFLNNWFKIVSFRMKMERYLDDREATIRKKVDELRMKVDDDFCPAELVVSLLPLRKQQTDDDWRENKRQLYLLEARIANFPEEGYWVENLEFDIELKGSSEHIIIDCYPTTDFESAENVEFSFTNTGRILKSASNALRVEGTATVGKFEASGGVDHQAAKEEESGTEYAKTVSFSTTQAKVIHNAAGKRVRWSLHSTIKQNPVGGHKFLIMFLSKEGLDNVVVDWKLTIKIEEWGKMSKCDSVTVSF